MRERLTRAFAVAINCRPSARVVALLKSRSAEQAKPSFLQVPPSVGTAPGEWSFAESALGTIREDCFVCCRSYSPTNLKGDPMNKLEIIDHIAKSADISKAAAGRSLDAAVTAIKTAMKKGSMVTLVGFGTFYVGRRAARLGRNPQTGAEINIKAARVPKFRPGKALKDAVN